VKIHNTKQAHWPKEVPGSPTYTHTCNYISTGVRLRGITFPSPLFMHCPQCNIYICTNKIQKFIFSFHLTYITYIQKFVRCCHQFQSDFFSNQSHTQISNFTFSFSDLFHIGTRFTSLRYLSHGSLALL
jgi:hypothetical protein